MKFFLLTVLKNEQVDKKHSKDLNSRQELQAEYSKLKTKYGAVDHYQSSREFSIFSSAVGIHHGKRIDLHSQEIECESIDKMPLCDYMTVKNFYENR